MDFGAKNVLFVRYRAVFRWTTLVPPPFILLRTKVHSAVSSRRRGEPDLHLIKQVEQVVRLASEALARIRSLRSTKPIQVWHFTSKV
jgi:hypothetical protein